MRTIQEIEDNLEKIGLCRIGCALLRGRVDDAEGIAKTMQTNAGSTKIEEWKKRYAGIPHGQWKG